MSAKKGILKGILVTTVGIIAATICSGGAFCDGIFSAKGDAKMNATTMKSKVIHATSKDFREKAMRSEGATIVDFYAEWCGPCRALGPILEKFAEENPSVTVVKVNVDDSPQLAADFRVSSIPHLVVIKNGKVTAQHTGIAEIAKLKTLVTR